MVIKDCVSAALDDEMLWLMLQGPNGHRVKTYQDQSTFSQNPRSLMRCEYFARSAFDCLNENKSSETSVYEEITWSMRWLYSHQPEGV